MLVGAQPSSHSALHSRTTAILSARSCADIDLHRSAGSTRMSQRFAEVLMMSSHRRRRNGMDLFRRILNKQDSVPCLPAMAEMQIGLALNVHEDNPSSQSHGDHRQLRPEGPIYQTPLDIVGGPFDEHTQRPDDAQGSRTVEQNRAAQSSPLNAGNVKAAPLVEGLDLGVHDEGELAQLAGVRLGGGEPLLEARLVDVLQAAGAVAWRQERILGIALAVADAADVAAVLGGLAAARTKPDIRIMLTGIPIHWLDIRRGLGVVAGHCRRVSYRVGLSLGTKRV